MHIAVPGAQNSLPWELQTAGADGAMGWRGRRLRWNSLFF